MSGNQPPVFVVVGNVNQGKSSIVATLAENEGVHIDSLPGTTDRCSEYTFEAEGRVLFRLVDTPGFQDARRALGWLRERSNSASDRRRTLRQFVEEQERLGDFVDERRLLVPILDGASILYVMDASSPLQPSQEAEMEILRWSGQPAMALINRTRVERNLVEDWKPTLQQFFSVVREFDAQGARFADRIALLKSFRELRDDWRQPMDLAIAAMEREWIRRRRQAAECLSHLLVEALTHVEKANLPPSGVEPPTLRGDLARRFEDVQRRCERQARRAIEQLFRHDRLDVKEDLPQVLEADLFSGTSWRLFGLTRRQLGVYGASWGAAIGTAVDLMVGGLSFFTGLVIGGVMGGVAGWFGSVSVARTFGSSSTLARRLFPGELGLFLCHGPVTNPAYAWMLLDRGLVHYIAVRDRAHASRHALEVGGVQEAPRSAEEALSKLGAVSRLPRVLRDPIDRDLRRLLEAALSGKSAASVRDALVNDLERTLAEI